MLDAFCRRPSAAGGPFEDPSGGGIARPSLSHSQRTSMRTSLRSHACHACHVCGPKVDVVATTCHVEDDRNSTSVICSDVYMTTNGRFKAFRRMCSLEQLD